MDHRKEGKYGVIFDEALDMLMVADVETGLIIDCNKAAAEALGWKKEELIGRHQRTLHPAHDQADEFSKTFLQHIASKNNQILETQFVTRGGELLDVAIKAGTFDLGGKKVMLGIVRDISSEKKYQREIDNLSRFPDENPSPVMRSSAAGITLYINKAGQTLLKPWNIEIGKPMPEFFQRLIGEVCRDRAMRREEFRIDGKTFHFTVTPVSGEEYVNIYALDITHLKEIEDDLRESEQRYNLAQSAANIGSWELEITTGKVHWSAYVFQIFGLPEDGFPGTFEALLALIHPDDRAKVVDAIAVTPQESHYHVEHRIVRPDGTIRWVRQSGQIFSDQENKPHRMLGVVQDITAEKSARDRNLFLSRAVEFSPVSVIITELDGTITYVNPKFVEVTGYSREEVIGKNPRILNSGHQPADFYRSMWVTLSEGKEWRGEFCNRKKDGGEFWESALISAVLDEETSKPLYYVAIKEEITEKKLQAERINYLALHDQLTSLYNRISFLDHLGKAVSAAKRNGTNLALLYLDLDGFKEVNDNLGHSAGDAVLKEVGSRLLGCVREMDVVARLGGDEFAVIATEFHQRKEIDYLAKRIIDALGKQFYAGAKQCTIGVSIGVSVFPEDEQQVEDLVKKADQAMYRVKKSGKNAFSYFSAPIV